MSKHTPRIPAANRPFDYWATPHTALLPLIPMLRREGVKRFAEPACGGGQLVRAMTAHGFHCLWQSDLRQGVDALDQASFGPVDAIVTNPPWTRSALHPMIEHFARIAPTWLLFQADWAFNERAARFLQFCTHVVPVGRVKWVRDSEHEGKENIAWYRFAAGHKGGPRIVPRLSAAKLAKYLPRPELVDELEAGEAREWAEIQPLHEAWQAAREAEKERRRQAKIAKQLDQLAELLTPSTVNDEQLAEAA